MSDDEGHRLFYIGSLFSRPYLIPDAATEARLFRKMTWYHTIVFIFLISVQPFLFRYYFRQPLFFFIFLASAIAVLWLAVRILFYFDLRSLERKTARLSLRTYFTGMARKHSEAKLGLGLLACFAFVVGGTLMASAGGWKLVYGLLSVVFFGCCGLGWGYALHLKKGMAEQSSEE